MKTILYLAIIASVIGNCSEKKLLNQIIFDQKANSDILYGYSTLEGFKIDPFNQWFEPEYDSYIVDTTEINKIDKAGLDKVGITVVMGTWCSDSRMEVPRFIKILETLGYKSETLEIINVDSKKTAVNTKTDKLNIERIPTFIFYDKDKELGRIIESPKESLEKDMLKIIGA